MDYQSSWQDYAFREDSHRLATVGELKEAFTTVDLSKKSTEASGPVLLCEGTKVVVNNGDEHWLCVGETGSKKTRCFVRPLLYTLMKARESAVITDVKGELSSDPTVRALMREQNIKGVFIDFRGFKGDCYDLFSSALEARKRGDVGLAHNEIARMVDAMAKPLESEHADPFWNVMAKQYLTGILRYLLEVCFCNPSAEKYFNILTLARFIDAEGNKYVDRIGGVLHNEVTNTTLQALRGVVNTAEKTRASISVSVNAVIKDFLSQDALMKMLSHTSFDAESLYDTPTFVFLIIPDESDAYSMISGQVIDSLYSKLVGKHAASFSDGSTPSCRVNWVCDEFCNVKINGMRSKISASRSRDMRFFLAIQSLMQLKSAYPEAADTILGNCKNLVFLQSSDEAILNYVSARSGITRFSANPSGEYLVRTEDLRRLKKTREYKDAYFLRDSFVFPTRLPDGDRYPCVKKFVGAPKERFEDKVSTYALEALSPAEYFERLSRCEMVLPYRSNVSSATIERILMEIRGFGRRMPLNNFN